ncbi:MAG: hypothetical protein ACXVRP_11270 [Solirubrobacteraceae bacterium]
MRTITRLLLVTVGLSPLALGSAGGAPSHLDSGIRGLVTYGPTCPVQRPGQTCTRPYQALIVVRSEPAGIVVARVRSARDGRFVVRLPNGRYRLEPRNGRPFPRAPAQTVRVLGHRFTAAEIQFDSGIR